MKNKILLFLSKHLKAIKTSKAEADEDLLENQDNMLGILEEKFSHRMSYKTKEAKIKGKPVPWFNYPAIEFLESLDLSGMSVFEYGSGIGTLYWQKNAKKVISVESDKKWYKRNSKVLLKVTKEGYINSIAKTKHFFDMIIVDGVYRYDSAAISTKYLKKGGLIILDNSEWYPKTSEMLRKKGFKQIDFSGFGPVVYFTWKTSFFSKSFGSLKYKENNYIPVGSYKQVMKEE